MAVNASIGKVLRLFMSFLLGSGLASLITFVAMPIYTRMLAPEEFGYFDLSNTIATIAAALIYADVWVGVMRLAMRDSNLESWLGPGLSILLLSTVILGLGGLVIYVVLDPPYLWLIYLATVLKSVASFWGYAARGVDLVKLFATTGAINAIITLTVSVALLKWSPFAAGSLFLGIAAGSLAQILIVEIRVHVLKRVFKERTPLWSSELWRFILPLGINSVAFWLFTGAGRLIVANEMGLADIGIYAAAAKLGGLVAVLATIVTLVWQQLSFEGDSKDQAFYARGTNVAAALYGIGGALAIPAGVWFYQTTVDSRYLSGWETVPGFLIVAVLAGYSNFIGNIFYTLERTFALTLSTLLCLTIVLCTTVPLVHGYGINGANIALAVGYVCNIALRHLFLYWQEKIRLPVLKICTAAIGVTWVAIMTVAVNFLSGVLAAILFSVAFSCWIMYSEGVINRICGKGKLFNNTCTTGSKE